MVEFRRGTEHYKTRGGELGQISQLADEEKERLCRSLLAEFGVTSVRYGSRGELIHGCILPFGQHKDQEQNPTASLNYEKLVYNCFGCASGGSILWLIGLMRDISSGDARRWLESETGLGDEEKSLALLLDYFDAVYSPEKRVEPPMPRLDVKVLDPWKKIHPYMTEIRGVPEETLLHFWVGYGVIQVKMGEKKWVDSHRIVIPHFWHDQLVGWQTRRLIKDGTPKYKSSPDFPKDRTIFNYQPDQESVVVFESPMNVLSKYHLAHHVEATFGNYVTDKQLRLLAMHPEVVLFMDNDKAGYEATERMGTFLTDYCNVWVVENPWTADAAQFSDGIYLDLVESAVPFSAWTPPTELVEWKTEEVSTWD